MKDIVERFLKYVSFETTSDDESDTCPSTAIQLNLAKYLFDELNSIGLKDVKLDDNGYVYATLPSNVDKEVQTVGFISHMDTAPDLSGKDVKPQFVEYKGGTIKLNDEYSMTEEEFPALKDVIGETLITTDGTTLLGADDKAGLVSILEAAIDLLNNPNILHGDIWVAFGPDEEIGKGAHRFKAERMPVQFAYTLDSGVVGKLEYETFNAARAVVKIKGTSVHPGQAKDVMVNALAEAAKLFSKLPEQEVPEKTSGYEGFYMLAKQSGNIGMVESEYIIRDHSMEKFQERKETFAKIVEEQNASYDVPRIECHIYDEYFNMYEVLKEDMISVEVAKEAYRQCGIEPDIQPFRGGTDGCIITFKGIPTPNLFTGAENLHGQYEFVTLESMEKAKEVVLTIIQNIIK